MKKIIGILILLGVFSILFWITYDALGSLCNAIGAWVFSIVVTFLIVIGVFLVADYI